MKPIGSSNVTSNSDQDSQIWQSFKDIVERADQRKYQWAKLNRNKFITEARKVGIF